MVERNAWNLPRERYNCEWVREQDVGLVFRNFRATISSRFLLIQRADGGAGCLSHVFLNMAEASVGE